LLRGPRCINPIYSLCTRKAEDTGATILSIGPICHPKLIRISVAERGPFPRKLIPSRQTLDSIIVDREHFLSFLYIPPGSNQTSISGSFVGIFLPSFLPSFLPACLPSFLPSGLVMQTLFIHMHGISLPIGDRSNLLLVHTPHVHRKHEMMCEFSHIRSLQTSEL
jgi:hypothetical protein